MKKLRTGLTVLAVLIGTGSVIASNAASVNSGDPVYNWETYDQSGNQTGVFSNKTQAQMEDITGCDPAQTTICARAFNAQDQEVPSVDLHYQ